MTEATFERMRVTVELADKLKAALKRKNKRQGWTECPVCGHKVTAWVEGTHNHFRMRCATAGCLWLME